MGRFPKLVPARSALRIAGVYALAAGAWIILSDELAFRLFGSAPQFALISQYKGLFFVAVTSLLLYAVLSARLASIAASQRALSESESRFAAFMDHLPVAAFLRDPEGRYVYTNACWQEHFAGGLDWRGAAPSRFFPSALVQEADEDHARVLAGEAVDERPLRLKGSSGERDWLVRRFPVQLDGRIFVGGIAVDVTDQRCIEDQIARLAKMEAIGLLAGGIAHDFNNLLTVISGYAQLLDLTHPAHAVAEICKATERATLLTGQLLAFSRRQVAQPEPLDLNELVTSTLSLLQRLVGERIRLEPDLSPGAAGILADEGQIQQVLLNLIINGRDAMPNGGAIHISTRRIAFKDGSESKGLGLAPGLYTLLTVSDEGHGMDAATLSRVFEPFFTTKERGRGTGLGLSTVYGIVTHGGGAITAESSPGAGATFHVYLPAADEPDLTAQSGAPSQQGQECILLVEDDDAVRNVAARMLEALGYRVLEAAGGPQALAAHSAAAGVQLVVTDVSMPELQGPELLNLLRERDPGIRAIFMTGYSEEMANLEPGQRGAAVLPKPFTLQSLGAAVRAALDAPPCGA
ncbi:MAG: response regulator [Acidobacteria bacterium]|nr:response regulator [Acidobacteriota bacterium]